MHSGERIRQYRLKAQLGQGGMGEVWFAWDETLDREVAIKVMRGSLIDSDEFRARFLSEARRQARLAHPNIPPVYDYFADAAQTCLVLQLINGKSLKALLESKAPLEVPVAIGIARDFLAALDYAHQCGVVHRDVKPSNILVSSDGVAHLIDFGVAIAVGEARLTKTGRFVGTFEYSSPEQVRTPQKVDHRTDVYSAGCVVYEMLTGRPPFLGADDGGEFEVQHAQVFDNPKPMRELRPSIPEGVDRVVQWSLEKDPADRLPGCGEFRRLLAENLTAAPDLGDHVQPQKPQLPPFQPPPVKPRKHAFLRVLLIALVVFLFIRIAACVLK